MITNEETVRAIAEEILHELDHSWFGSVSPRRKDAVAAILSKYLAAAPEQSPRVCVRCGHNNVDREGNCKHQIFHPKHLYGNYPARYCACRCSFPASVPLRSSTHIVVKDEGGGEWSVQAWFDSEDKADLAANALKHLATAPERKHWTIRMRVSQLNADLGAIQEYKAEHPDQKLGYYTSNVGSILNAYREGDVTFDEAVALLRPANPLPAPEQSPRVCVRCEHRKTDKKSERGICEVWIIDTSDKSYGGYPCGCHCEFPASVPESAELSALKRLLFSTRWFVKDCGDAQTIAAWENAKQVIEKSLTKAEEK